MKVDFVLVRVGLVAAPVLAVMIFVFLRRQRFPAQLVILAASMLLLYLAIALSGFRFVTVRTNLSYTVAAYFSYCLLAVMCLRIPARSIRFLVFVLAIIPIGCGYLLTTIRSGLFALSIIIGFYNTTPNHVEEVAPGLTCRVTELGWGGSLSSFYAIGLYQSWNWAPFLERKVLGALVVRDYVESDSKVVSCFDLVARYEKA